MADFETQYFSMKESDVVEYAKTKLVFFDADAELTCTEIGDGNLNYVFRVVDEKNKKSLIIKQAGPVARISDDFKLSPDRNRIESEMLELQNKWAPGFVPKMYRYDPIMNCCAMEDLSEYEIMRSALLKHKIFPLFADQITTFLVNTLLSTTDVILEHKEKKALVRRFINPELCEISEDLVFTEPFYDCPRNDVFEGSKEFVKQHIWSDEKLLLETAKLKFEFMSKAEALIHGDLHTGSIFIKEDSMKVIDPEFAFYGPAGYDVGNVIANLIFAYVNGLYTIENENRKKGFLSYLETTIREVIDQFSVKFLILWDENVTERTAKLPGFKEYYLASILHDSAATTGLELCRRMIGIAYPPYTTSLAKLFTNDNESEK